MLMALMPLATHLIRNVIQIAMKCRYSCNMIQASSDGTPRQSTQVANAIGNGTSIVYALSYLGVKLE